MSIMSIERGETLIFYLAPLVGGVYKALGPVFTVLSPVIVGALTGLGLSFIALSPLVIGGIVGSMVPALFTVYFVVNTFPDKEGAIFFSIATLASAAIGVGLAAAATAIFPGAMLGAGSAALAGAIVGVIAPILGVVAVLTTMLTTEKVNEYIILPIAEKVSGCFSSKGQEA